MLPRTIVVLLLQVLSFTLVVDAVPQARDNNTIESQTATVTTDDLIIFHDLEGNAVSQRNYTIEEVAFFTSQDASQPEITLETRAEKDNIFIWERFHYGEDSHLLATYSGWNLCNDVYYFPGGEYPLAEQGNVCHKTWTMFNNWYKVDNCNENENWISGQSGKVVASLLGSGNKKLGDCVITSHSSQTPCTAGYEYVTSIKCYVD